ncbi:zinc ribbon domain-containing protein [Aromatoleum toluolicum]|uniref:3-hydroxy-3-methylglutaryl CoA synthase n=1 Tax=Aromatoleum toluolicum TaxID=90060 RepID=A0ABX1NAU5_9RHOO|nr:3-oxoacyl-[acyl-carrier-protein] synthase III C-terminal domain-containing protein [Aromatoleum toluolicum]NMF96402.1 zinc ribbon domain-containing protein [Aromatoleum toluolicum]
MNTNNGANNGAATDRGILAVGAYLPRLRLDRKSVAAGHRWMAPGLRGLAQGVRSMANWDEDAITMAVEAGRRALAAAQAPAPEMLTLASTTLPFADRLNAAVVASALSLPKALAASDCGGSLRAGGSALIRALQGSGGQQLLIASERRIPRPASTAELMVGDGAAALLVGEGEPIARLLGSASLTADFVDHFRESGRDGDYGWEERWVRDEGLSKLVPPVVKQALQAAGVDANRIDHFVMPEKLRKVGPMVAKKVGVRPETIVDPLFDRCGDTGAAHPLLMLARTLAKAGPGQTILVVQFGSGCDALVLETTDRATGSDTEPAWLDEGQVETNYLKYLSFTGQIELEWGMRAEMDNKTALSAAWRAEETVHGFSGGRCGECGTVQFPASRICVNPDCGAVDTQQPYRLADEPAKIRSFTCDWLSYKPCPPFMFGHVEFANAARVLMEFADCDPADLAVGVPLDMVFRIKEVDPMRGFRRYFWKAKPQLKAGE